jgi:hypothetical protein
MCQLSDVHAQATNVQPRRGLPCLHCIHWDTMEVGHHVPQHMLVFVTHGLLWGGPHKDVAGSSTGREGERDLKRVMECIVQLGCVDDVSNVRRGGEDQLNSRVQGCCGCQLCPINLHWPGWYGLGWTSVTRIVVLAGPYTMCVLQAPVHVVARWRPAAARDGQG